MQRMLGVAVLVLGLPLVAWAAPSGVYELTLSKDPGNGAGIEKTMLLERPYVNVARVTLRNGTVLPSHFAAIPGTMQVLKGTGWVRYGDGTRRRLVADTLVVLDPQVPHEITPEPGSDMILLIQQLKGGAGAESGDHHH